MTAGGVQEAPRWYDLDASLTLLAATYSRYFGVCACCPHGSWLPGFGTKATHVCECVPELGAIRLCAEHHAVLHSDARASKQATSGAADPTTHSDEPSTPECSP